MELMDAVGLVTAHVQDHVVVYAVAAIIIVPVILITRQYSVPGILYALEFCAYSAFFHIVVHAIIKLAAWFKDQSTMERAFSSKDIDHNPGWTTPLIEFWNKDLYSPQWVIYFEGAVLLVLLVLMWRIRPLRPQRKKPKPPKKPGDRGNKTMTGKTAGGRTGTGSYQYKTKTKTGGF